MKEAKRTRAIDLILRKRNGKELSPDQIDFLVQGFTSGEIPDYQMAAFLMAVYFKGMSFPEIMSLTESMILSGSSLDLSYLPGPTGDKHSTGGVGDKVSLVFVPLVASCGVYIAKMSGRGLGHTGGTIDKLESIPGMRTELTTGELLHQVEKIGCAIVAQTPDLAPADGKIYALRDVTGTVDCIPLIASSIMSKKIASGATNIVIDIKCGRGSFLRTKGQALTLAKILLKIGTKAGRKLTCLLTSMEEPLGQAVGNSLEVKEAVETLKGKGPPDFLEVVLDLAADLLFLSGIAKSVNTGRTLAQEKLLNGEALEKFRLMISAQGGDQRVVYDPELLPAAKNSWVYLSPKEGFIKRVDALKIGQACQILGGGREKKGDKIDHAVGIIIKAKKGNRIFKGDPLAEVFLNDQSRLEEAQKLLAQAFTFSEDPVTVHDLLLGRVSNA